MNLSDINFREIDRKWIVFDRSKDIKSIYKNLKIKADINPVIGYVYISHEDGLQIKIVGNVIKEDNNYELDEQFIYKDTSISYSKDLKYHFTILEDKIIKKIKYANKIIEQIEPLYEKNSIVESRKIENIDSFRHEVYIDDVELVLKKDKKPEYLWARIEDCSKNNLVFVCSLLDSSKKRKNYKENTLVIAKLVENKKTIDFEIDGIVDRVSK